MITPPTVRVSYIILTITLTVILISSPVIAGFSPSSLLSPIALKVEFASATSSSENNDDNEGEEGGGEEEQPTTDVTTDGEEEELDGNSGDVQQEGATEEDDEEEGADGELEQFATVVGEICDDFEDNDGDGLIDSADADCAAPLTQGTVTAPPPTTPASPPSSLINTTATNSTNNTLTASEITTTREITAPPSTEDEASGATTEEGNTVTDADGRPVIDLENECDSYEELGIPPPPLGFGQPPDAKWYHCPPGVGVWVAPNGTSSLGTGGEAGGQQGLAQGGGGQQQPPPSVTNTTTTDTDYALYPEGTEVNDIDINCDSFEELGYEPPPPQPGDPPHLKWFDCDGVSISAVPTGSTTTTTPNSGTGTVGGGQQGLTQGQRQQQPNSASACPPQPTNYYDAQAHIINVQLTPSSQTTTNPCPPGESSATSPQQPLANTTSQQPGVEICDDLEDNDGDGLIDLEDVEDCGAPLTRGTVTAPTTPSPPPSVVNTTATNNTGNTLTASGTTSPDSGQQQQQQQQQPPPAGAPVTQSTTTTTTATDSDTGREGLEICDDLEDNDGDGFVDYLDNDCAAPTTQGTVTTQGTETDPANLPIGKSEDKDGNIWTHYPDGRNETTGVINGRYFGTTTEYPDGTTKKYLLRPGVTITDYPEGVSVTQDSTGQMAVRIGGEKNCGRYASDFERQYRCLTVWLASNGTAFAVNPISNKPVRPLTPDAAGTIYGLLLILEVRHPT